MNKLNQDLNIARSKKINAARLKKMEERNQCLMELKQDMIEKLKAQMSGDRDKYLKTLKDLIMQGMIKLAEPALQIKCREEDVGDIQGMITDLQTDYANFMQEQTGREYATELTVLEDNFLTDEKDKGCGGVILYSTDSRVVCPNTIIQRLELVYEEMLPQIRRELFPSK